MRAALDLFTGQGYHASTTPLIASKARVAEGTIYRHFATKEHLFNEIYRAGLRLFTGVVADSPLEAPCHTRLEGIANVWCDIAVREPALVRIVFVRAFRAPFDDRSRAATADFSQAVQRVVAGGKAEGKVRSGSVAVWTDVWLRLISLTLERVADGEWKRDDPAARLVLDGAWDAIRAPLAPGGQHQGNRQI